MNITIDKADELIAAMTRLAEALEKKEASSPPKKNPVPAQGQPEVTDVQVRAVFTAQHKAGKKEALGGLLKKYGAAKISEVDPACYAELFREAEAL